MDLHERIKMARKEAGFKSRDKLAEFLGTTRDTIAAYEQGRVVPNDVFLQLMATKLHISYDWLKNGEGNMQDTGDLSELLNDETLSEEDKAIMKIYIALSPAQRQTLKDFATKVVAVQHKIKIEDLKDLTDRERIILQDLQASMED